MNYLLILFTLSQFILSSFLVHANNLPEAILCSFTMEDAINGKSNKASCSGYPEVVYSTSENTASRKEHCDVKSTFNMEVYNNFLINFKEKIVTYEDIKFIADWAKPKMLQYYISKGTSENEAKSKVNEEYKTLEIFSIQNIYFTKKRVYKDPVTEKWLKKKERYDSKVYNIVFDNRVFMLNEEVPDAIISTFSALGSNSWLDMRFGKCKIVK